MPYPHRYEGVDITPHMRRHLDAIMKARITDYMEWCEHNGFPCHYEKSKSDIDKETARLAKSLKLSRDEARFDKRPDDFIRRFLGGEFAAHDLNRPAFRHMATRLTERDLPRDTHEDFISFIKDLHRHSKMLTETIRTPHGDVYLFDGLLKLFDRKGSWLKPLGDWKSKSRNPERQFRHLTRFLMTKYEVPDFMDYVWLRNDTGSHKYRDAYVHVGRGHNIRTAKMPIALTKKVAHHMMQSPDMVSIEQAIRWGQILSIGGHPALVEAVNGCRVGDDFENNIFWESYFRLLIANPMFDLSYVGPIADYIYAQKFDSQDVVNAAGDIVREPPPQPGLSLKGRQLATLIEQTEQWHGALAKTSKASGMVFKPSGFPNYRVETGGKTNKSIWRIEELLSGQALIAEGNRHSHCVASYASSVMDRRISIWSLRMMDKNGLKYLQTIEVNNNNRQIVQCRGRHNRLPTQAEFDHVKQWAAASRLDISNWVRTEG